MNYLEQKDLEVGQLVWYVVYEGDWKPPSRTLMKVLATEPKLSVQNVCTGEVVEPFPIYTYFEAAHQQYVED